MRLISFSSFVSWQGRPLFFFFFFLFLFARGSACQAAGGRSDAGQPFHLLLGCRAIILFADTSPLVSDSGGLSLWASGGWLYDAGRHGSRWPQRGGFESLTLKGKQSCLWVLSVCVVRGIFFCWQGTSICEMFVALARLSTNFLFFFSLRISNFPGGHPRDISDMLGIRTRVPSTSTLHTHPSIHQLFFFCISFQGENHATRRKTQGKPTPAQHRVPPPPPPPPPSDPCFLPRVCASLSLLPAF